MTSFVGERAIEKGFSGRVILKGGVEGFWRLWTCSVQSHEADISRAVEVSTIHEVWNM